MSQHTCSVAPAVGGIILGLRRTQHSDILQNVGMLCKEILSFLVNPPIRAQNCFVIIICRIVEHVKTAFQAESYNFDFQAIGI